MMTPEQSKQQDKFLTECHGWYAHHENKKWIDAVAFLHMLMNMDYPAWMPIGSESFCDGMNHIVDLLDLAATLDNPGLPRGWLFTWQQGNDSPDHKRGSDS